MEIQDLIAQFRTEVADEVPPYLWSDDEVLLYVIDAQDQFVRSVGGIADITTDTPGNPATRLADLVVTDGDPYSALSPYILKIRDARLLTARRDLVFANVEDLPRLVDNDYGQQVGQSLDDTDLGEVRYGLLGVRDNFVRWHRVPNADDTCRLAVFRLPFPRIANQEDLLEIPEQHHLRMVEWMKKRAYSKEDAETYDKELALRNEASFRAYCEEVRQTEVERRRAKPRAVVYGGL